MRHNKSLPRTFRKTYRIFLNTKAKNVILSTAVVLLKSFITSAVHET